MLIKITGESVKFIVSRYIQESLINMSLKGNCLTEKENARTMHEKRHKINKFANYQNMIVRNSPAFDCHVFVPSQNR